MKKNQYSDDLYKAIVNHDEEKFEHLLRENGNLNCLRVDDPIGIYHRLNDFENIYPLEIACKESPEMAKKLLEAGADPNVIDEYIYSTPLIYALETNNEERFELAMLLIQYGADVNHVDANRRTAINACVEVLDTDSEKTKRESMELLRYILNHCRLMDIVDKSQNNPLNAAATYNNVEAIQYIIENGYLDVNITSAGYTPLMRAVLAQNVESCQLLLKQGADKEIVSPKGKTAFDYAAAKGNRVLMDLLK